MVSPRSERFDVDGGQRGLGYLVDLLEQRPAWHADALCREYPQLDWFADRSPRMEAQCVDVCRRCLVVDECRHYALADPTLVGIWGATTATERQALRRLTAEPNPRLRRRRK